MLQTSLHVFGFQQADVNQVNHFVQKEAQVLFTSFSVNPLIFITTLIHFSYSGLWLNVGWGLGDRDRCLGLWSTGTGGDA